MSKHRLFLGSLTAILLASVLIVFSGKVQSNRQKPTVDQVPFGQAAKQLDDAARPTVDFENPGTIESHEKNARKLKNARYDKFGAVNDLLSPDTAEVIWEPEWTAGLSDLPAEKSDLVAEGTVADSKAFLSEDRSGVYSEFTVNVLRVFKVGEGVAVNPGDAIVAERFGGKVKFPSGQVVLYRIDGQGAPLLGRQYLFFLAKAGQGNYKLLTAYEIHGQKVFALDGSRINFRGQGNWKFDRHNGEDLTSFIGKVERTINNSQAAGNRPSRESLPSRFGSVLISVSLCGDSAISATPR